MIVCRSSVQHRVRYACSVGAKVTEGCSSWFWSGGAPTVQIETKLYRLRAEPTCQCSRKCPSSPTVCGARPISTGPRRRGTGWPCVVMGHGGSATKRLGLPAYAEKFTTAGLAVLAFDYRYFGASGGEPRQIIKVAEQQDDYRAAVRYMRGRDDIDPRRVALWGTSLSGGHVLAVAATDPDIAAVVSQVPLIDGWHRGRTLGQRLNWDVTWRTLQFTVAAVRDVIGAKLGQGPYLVPVVADSGEAAVFTEPEAKAAFEALGGEAVGWRNALAPAHAVRPAPLPQRHRGEAAHACPDVPGRPRPASVAQVRGADSVADE